MEILSREFTDALAWELPYADDLVVMAKSEDEPIRKLLRWKNDTDSKG